MPVSPFPWLSINHRFWQAESKDMNFKSQLDWNWTKKNIYWPPGLQQERTKPHQGGKYWSRAIERCGEFRCTWIWVCASIVWRCRCRGHLAVKDTGSGSRQLCSDAVWRSHEGYIHLLKTIWISRRSGIAYRQKKKTETLSFHMRVVLKNLIILGRTWIPRGYQLGKMDFCLIFII